MNILRKIWNPAKAASLLICLMSLPVLGEEPTQKPTFEEYLRSLAMTRDEINETVKTFAPNSFLWMNRWRRDPVLGYVERDYELLPGPASLTPETWKWPGGIDGSGVVVKIQANGARKAL